MKTAVFVVPRLTDADPLPPSHDCPSGVSPLDDLFRTEKPRLMRCLARWRARDPEDLVQHVFLRLVSTSRQARPELRHPSAYLRQAIRHAFIDEMRQRNCEPTADHVPLDGSIIDEADPVAALEARDRLARLSRAVDRLKPLTRDVFVAHRVSGYSYDEIAQRTGLSVRGVEKQMRTAIKLLGRHLRQHD